MGELFEVLDFFFFSEAVGIKLGTVQVSKKLALFSRSNSSPPLSPPPSSLF